MRRDDILEYLPAIIIIIFILISMARFQAKSNREEQEHYRVTKQIYELLYREHNFAK